MVGDCRLNADERGNVAADGSYMTNLRGGVARGNVHRGQALTVSAIREACTCAPRVDQLRTCRIDLPASPIVRIRQGARWMLASYCESA